MKTPPPKILPAKEEPAAPRAVTLRDVAKATGLHFSTVSLALRDSPRLPAATRRKVQQTARRLGYRPDPMLAALNAYRRARSVPQYQATIAWVNNWPQRERLYDKSDFLEYFQGVTERAAQLGYATEEFWLHASGMDPARLARVLRARNIQAVLLAPQPNPNTRLAFDPKDFSVICFGYSTQPAVLNVVTNHQFHSLNLAVQHLLELGYRRLGLCIPAEMDDKAESNYLSCLLMTQWKNPALAAIPPLLTDTNRQAVLLESLLPWLQTYQPDVVIGLRFMAERLEALGYSIPRQIGFVNLSIGEDDTHWSGTHQNNRIIGRKAVDMVVGMLHRGERGVPAVPVRMLVESSWRAGKTVRRQRTARQVITAGVGSALWVAR